MASFKNKKHGSRLTRLPCLKRELHTLYLAGTQATGTNADGLVRAADNSLYLADVGLPSSIALAVRMGNRVAEYNTLAADTALCHGIYLLIDACFRTEYLVWII